MVLVDSSVWIDHLNRVASGPVERLRELIPATPLLIIDLIFCEVLQGFRSSAQARLVEQALRRFQVVTLCSPDLAVAVAAAVNHRFLRARGCTIRKTIDVIIGTFCIERGHRLLHSNRDFEPMERFLGLQVV